MDSEDEMAYTCSSMSADEDYLVDDEDHLIDDEDGFIEELNDDKKLLRPQNYTILSADEIKQYQDDDISQVSSLLSLSREESYILLSHYDWSINTVQENWFSNENKVRVTAGLPHLEPAKLPKSKKLSCGICFDLFHYKSMIAGPCGHRYCQNCWKGYLESAIKDGPGCVSLRCPEPSCTIVINHNIVANNPDIISFEDRQRYDHFLLRSYIEKSQSIKWCPAAGCDFSVKLVDDGDSFDVNCKCLHGFCWKCMEDSHRPVDCETVAKWIAKNSSEAENTQWILSYTKPCPKCKKPIEKNHGCNHMTCRDPCSHQFCWICLGAWKDHGGQNYNCNRYKKDESETVRELAKRSIRRYTHYYERWASNNRSRLMAVENLRNLESTKLEVVKRKLAKLMSTIDVKFITDAWVQIVECRRVLQWTYAYGYYYIDGDHGHKKEYFEYEQGLAESALENLHQCAEREGKEYFENEGEMEEFSGYRMKLINHTKATREYFDNLVQALETGLKDIGFSKSLHSEVGTSSGSSEAPSWWECRLCTFVNEIQVMICNECGACQRCTFINSISAQVCRLCSGVPQEM